MEFEELLNKLNKAKILQRSYDWQEDLSEDLCKELENAEEICSELDVDKHRWYELSTTVLKINNRFLGVEHISELYSKSSEYIDIFHTLKFFEMQEIMSPTYLRKK